MFRRAAGIWAKIAGAHRSDDETGAGVVTEFFLPRLNRGFLLRMAVVALLAGVTFGFVLIPCVINGESMVPTYPAKGFTFCWRGMPMSALFMMKFSKIFILTPSSMSVHSDFM